VALNNAKTAWCTRLAGHLKRAQEVGSARTDIPSDELAGFCWDVWEGALLRMKVEKSTASIRKTIALLFEVFLRSSAS
jgi:TetR/AcrR family transcriptional repressor of nem operon